MKPFPLLLSLSLLACAENQPTPTESSPPPVGESSALQTVQSLYTAAAAGDNATIGQLLGDDVQWVEAEGGPFEAGNPYVGVQGVGAGVFGPLAEQYEGFTVTPERFLVDGDRVVAEGRYTGTHRESGEALDAAFAHVFTTAGERITHYQQYTDTYQWRCLAGTADCE